MPEQTPDWQLSPVVQALLSLHAEPFVLVGYAQMPVLVLDDQRDTDRCCETIQPEAALCTSCHESPPRRCP